MQKRVRNIKKLKSPLTIQAFVVYFGLNKVVRNLDYNIVGSFNLIRKGGMK